MERASPYFPFSICQFSFVIDCVNQLMMLRPQHEIEKWEMTNDKWKIS